jgi:2-polyprenyl-6-hydroxyphenyl methylase/3-demethylubiquinone-9 3-methyltransferase
MAEVNNEIYENLGERWYQAWDDPVALLRAQGRVIHPWISERIKKKFGENKVNILDVGCGAGLLSNELALEGHAVTGVDMSPESLRIARLHDATRSVTYVEADALELPFPEGAFEVVTCMDFLEHVHFPARYIAEMSRVLRPGGLLFFHTFNRNVLSWIVIIKGVEWFVKNTPKDMHVIELFIRPEELEEYAQRAGVKVQEMTGIRPVISSIPLKSIFTGVVSPKMRFTLTNSLHMSYLGYGQKIK